MTAPGFFPAPYNYNGFNGKIDEFRIYNRALSALEIAGLAVLPVNLNSFAATKIYDDILLRWQTGNEVNSSHFNVQRSVDGINFTDIAMIHATGNSSTTTSYQYTDNTAKITAAKNIYYRLQQVDKDDMKKLSDIVLVKFNAATKGLAILQNPASALLKLQINMPAKENIQLQIHNAAGQQIISKSILLNGGDNFTSLPVNTLASGFYTLTLLSAQAGKQTQSFIKQ